MFEYTDPVGRTLLTAKGAMDKYRRRVHAWYHAGAVLPNSGFTLLEAFQEMLGGARPDIASVSWVAFPRTAPANDQAIDSNRFQFQDEYVEWRVVRGPAGVESVTFSTEFPEYYEAFAAIGVDVLIDAVRDTLPGSNPTEADLFGPNVSAAAATPEGRARRFRAQLTRNPWNNARGILCLTQGANTMGALFNLLAHCAVPNPIHDPTQKCSAVGQFCGPERNSDPAICTAAQTLSTSNRSLSAVDPVGVVIQELRGIWKINGAAVDINDPAQNQGAWSISRNGRRGILDITRGVTIGDQPILSGTQVSRELVVNAAVVSAPNALLPDWAQTGQESSRFPEI